MCANCQVKKENGTVSPSGEAQEGSQDEQLTPEKVRHNFIPTLLSSQKKDAENSSTVTTLSNKPV